MQRLTERDEYGNADIIGVDCADLQFNLEYEEFNKVTAALNKLAYYEDLRENGKLIILPCPIGTKVYRIIKKKSKLGNVFSYIGTGIFSIEERDKVGKRIFLTREEAADKLWNR